MILILICSNSNDSKKLLDVIKNLLEKSAHPKEIEIVVNLTANQNKQEYIEQAKSLPHCARLIFINKTKSSTKSYDYTLAYIHTHLPAKIVLPLTVDSPMLATNWDEAAHQRYITINRKLTHDFFIFTLDHFIAYTTAWLNATSGFGLLNEVHDWSIGLSEVLNKCFNQSHEFLPSVNLKLNDQQKSFLLSHANSIHLLICQKLKTQKAYDEIKNLDLIETASYLSQHFDFLSVIQIMLTRHFMETGHYALRQDTLILLDVILCALQLQQGQISMEKVPEHWRAFLPEWHMGNRQASFKKEIIPMPKSPLRFLKQTIKKLRFER